MATTSGYAGPDYPPGEFDSVCRIVTDDASSKMGINVGHTTARDSLSGPPSAKSTPSAAFENIQANQSDVTPTALATRPHRGRFGTKVTFSKHDLPFPRDSASRLVAKWSKDFMASLYDWLATLDDPWRGNSHPDYLAKVEEIWILVFPELRTKADHPAIEFLVRLDEVL